MKYRNWMVVLIAIGVWSFMPRGLALAVEPLTTYVNCSTGAPPYTPTTVGPNSSVEQQVTCNEGDTATGGGIEVLSPPLPLPQGVLVTTPENSFLFSGTSPYPPVGWQVVLQNTNLNLICLFNPKVCTTVKFRVCVACLTPES